MTVKADQLDAYDLKILNLLTAEGRISWRELADAVGLSLTPTLRRVRRLEQSGLIQGYSANLDERRLIGGIGAFVSISLERQSEDALAVFEARVQELEEVASCFQMTGDFDYLLRVVVRDLDHYQAMLARLTRVPVVSRIQSSFVLKSVVRRRGRII
ncbi:MAG: Lrp/AsnC family transcriptional regulator [Proteobacteria bacterium]|nr:Lrp/AsnC family transcriptional regulator [Pseudomonadota bacterium]